MTIHNFFLIVFIFLASMLCPQKGQAFCEYHCEPDLEFRAAAFIPESRLYRDIYGSVLPSLQLEASYSLIGYLRAWSNISFIFQEGHSIPLKDKTSILVVPWSAGLKYVFACRHGIELCCGAGIAFTCVRIKDHSPYVKPITQKYDVGGVVKLQLTKRFDCFYASVFTDYFFEDLHVGRSNSCVSRHSADIGGLFVGLSLGKEF